jgi:hypothetical protein
MTDDECWKPVITKLPDEEDEERMKKNWHWLVISIILVLLGYGLIAWWIRAWN